MRYPEILSYVSADTGASTTHTVNYPSGVAAGDYLFAVFRSNGINTITPPSGWTVLAARSAAVGPYSIAYIVATSALSGTFTYSTSNSGTGTHFVARINASRLQISSAVTATTANPDPPSLTHSLTTGARVMWMAIGLRHTTGTGNFTGFPSNFTDNNLASSSQVGSWAVATLESTTSPQNPGTFTLSASADSTAFTLAFEDQRLIIDEVGNATLSGESPSVVYQLGAGSIIAAGIDPTVTATWVGAWQLRVNGIPKLVLKGTLDIENRIQERSVASFTLIDDTSPQIVRGDGYTPHMGSFVGIESDGYLTNPSPSHYVKGTPVEMRDQDTHFRGYIHSAQTIKITDNLRYHTIRCMDNHYLADKRIVPKVYQNELAGDIVRDIWSEFLQAEGVLIGNVEDGPLVREARFIYRPASKCLDWLSEAAGFYWLIDSERRLYFEPRTADPAPFVIGQTDMLQGTVELLHSGDKYRNKQYITDAREITDELTETNAGDGVTRSYTMGFPLARVPTVEVSIGGGAYVAKTVGIKGVETGKDYYWSAGDSVIVQDDAGTLLTSADRIRVKYRGEFSVIASAIDDSQVVARQILEGGTGIVEDVASEPAITSLDAAFQSAGAKLLKYAQVGRRLTFTTEKRGLYEGQLLTVDHPDIKGDFLIESVRITFEDQALRWTITAVEGPDEGSWARVFDALGEVRTFVRDIGDNQILVVLFTASDTWSWAETVTAYENACDYPQVDYPQIDYPC